MRKIRTIEKKFIKLFLVQYPEYMLLITRLIEETNHNLSIIKRRIQCITDIIITNDNTNVEVLYHQYYTSATSNKDKFIIRHGNNFVLENKLKLKKRKRPENFSIFTKEYWIIRCAYSEENAIKKVQEIQSKISKNPTKKTIEKRKLNNPLTLGYWTRQGYTGEEAKQLQKPYIMSGIQNLDNMILKYGDEKGLIKYQNMIKKRSETLIKTLSSRRTAGYVSKASLSFFIPLYKKCRKLGLQRKDIYFGIRGSREFFMKDDELLKNGGIFVDFCIPKLNLVIEYNGSFWHPHPDIKEEDWKNPFTTYEDAVVKEHYRKKVIKSRNYDLFEIWDFEDQKFKLNQLIDIIKERYEERLI
jgi:hypothetical protein